MIKALEEHGLYDNTSLEYYGDIINWSTTKMHNYYVEMNINVDNRNASTSKSKKWKWAVEMKQNTNVHCILDIIVVIAVPNKTYFAWSHWSGVFWMSWCGTIVAAKVIPVQYSYNYSEGRSWILQ